MATFSELVELLKSAGAPSMLAQQLAAISAAEDSPGSPTVTVHDPTANDPNAISVGHFQINSDNFDWLSKALGTPVNAGALQASAELQARAALTLATKTPNGLNNWSTWQSYLKGEDGKTLTPSEQHAADAIRESLRQAVWPTSDAGSADASASGAGSGGGLLSNPVAVLAFPVIAIAAIAAAAFVSGFARPHTAPGSPPGAPRPVVPANAPHVPPALHGGVPYVPGYAAPPVGVSPPPVVPAPAGERPAAAVPNGPGGVSNVSLQAVPGAAQQKGRDTSTTSGEHASPAQKPAVATTRTTPWWVWAMLAAFAVALAAWWRHMVVEANRRRDAARRRRLAASRSASTSAGPRGEVPVFRDM